LTSVDGVGTVGIESFFDARLRDVTLRTPVRLSIDINIQSIVRDILSSAVKKYQAKGGFGLIMNVKTGEMITAVSLPDFNANNLANYKQSDLYNRFSLGVYELGSVFKVFLAA
jgi:cell division protein FtsI (penicillin-binding protein 3)